MTNAKNDLDTFAMQKVLILLKELIRKHYRRIYRDIQYRDIVRKICKIHTKCMDRISIFSKENIGAAFGRAPLGRFAPQWLLSLLNMLILSTNACILCMIACILCVFCIFYGLYPCIVYPYIFSYSVS